MVDSTMKLQLQICFEEEANFEKLAPSFRRVISTCRSQILT